jgi:hypothetical protein
MYNKNTVCFYFCRMILHCTYLGVLCINLSQIPVLVHHQTTLRIVGSSGETMSVELLLQIVLSIANISSHYTHFSVVHVPYNNYTVFCHSRITTIMSSGWLPLLPTILRVVWWCTSTGIWDKLIHKTTFWTICKWLSHIWRRTRFLHLKIPCNSADCFDLNSNLAEIVQCICNNDNNTIRVWQFCLQWMYGLWPCYTVKQVSRYLYHATFCIMIRVSLHTKSSGMFHAEFVYKLFPPKWRILTMKTLSSLFVFC